MIAISPLGIPLIGPLSSRIKNNNNQNLPEFHKLKKKIRNYTKHTVKVSYDSHYNKVFKNAD